MIYVESRAPNYDNLHNSDTNTNLHHSSHAAFEASYQFYNAHTPESGLPTNKRKSK